jgi:hypothetical protein
MNKAQKTLLLIIHLLCLLAQNHAFAQNPNIVSGYYVSPKGDSIMGQIQLEKSGGQVLQFMPAGTSSWQKLPPASVARAGDQQGLLIIARMIRSGQDTQQVFLRRTINGGNNLYEGELANSEKVFFIESPEKGTWIKVNKLGFESQLKILFAPCSSQENLPKLRYNSASLQRYVSEINRCAYPNTTPYTAKSPARPRLGIGLSAFYYWIDPSVTGNDAVAFKDYKNIQRPGASLLFKVNITPSFAVYSGIGYIDKKMSTKPTEQLVGFKVNKPGIPPYTAYDLYRFSTVLDFKYIAVPIGIAYTVLPYRKWSPVVHFGLTFQNSITNRVIKDYGDPVCEPCTQPDSGPSDYYFEFKYPPVRTNLANFFGGASLRYQPSKRHQLEINLTYYYQRETTGYIVQQLFPVQYTINMRTSMFQLGLTYYYLFNFK